LDFTGSPDSADFPGQTNNRTLVFDYERQRKPGPRVRAGDHRTRTGNDFPTGKTFRYAYTADHKLTHIWYPNEVRDNVDANPRRRTPRRRS